MGVQLEQYVRGRYPEFPIRNGGLGWEDYVPPLSRLLQNLMERYDAIIDLRAPIGRQEVNARDAAVWHLSLCIFGARWSG